MPWIALTLPELPLDLACRRWPEALRDSFNRTIPLAVTEGKRIRWRNPCARDIGILPGMLESSAQARAADVVLIARDSLREAEALREAALWALHFTPQVSLQPEGLLLDVSASLRLFGGRAALAGQLCQGIRDFGFTPQLASAPTATAAWLFARHADALHADDADAAAFADLLDRLPAMLLLSAQPHLDTLQAIGCGTIGQLRRLPRDGIARRFGRAMLAELDRAFGLEPETFVWFEAPPSFQAGLELPARVDSADALLSGARRLLMQMTGWLTARHAAVGRFSLLLQHESRGLRRAGLHDGAHDGTVTAVDVLLGNPSRELPHLTLLLQERLTRLTLSASVIALSLRADDIVQHAAPNRELFPAPASHAESTERLIERLASRLGEAAIARMAVAQDHRPERSSLLLPAQVRPARQQPAVGFFPLRPVWLLHEPLSLLVRDERPFYQSPLRMLIGPERIEAGWWDDGLATRDYFIACNDNHLLLWIYRERQGAREADAGWYLHGFFA
jgi:protein ImuB